MELTPEQWKQFQELRADLANLQRAAHEFSVKMHQTYRLFGFWLDMVHPDIQSIWKNYQADPNMRPSEASRTLFAGSTVTKIKPVEEEF